MKCLQELMSHTYTNWEQTGLVCLLALVIHVFISRVLLRGIKKVAASTENDVDDRLVHFFQRFYIVVLLFALFLVVLKIHKIEITPFLASAGIAGIAIGMAAKETLADIFAGVFLIADRPVRVGDRVKIDSIGKHWGSWGDILDLGLRRTKIKNTDGVIVNYPNSLLANSVITNFSYEDGPIRVRVRFQVNYNVDLDHACEVAREAIQASPNILPESAEVIVRSLWDEGGGHMLSGILLEGRYRINDVRHRSKIRSVVLKNITKACQREEIALASPRVRVETV
ncbi:mechanosensitive ion channel family protein [Akkermansiaceae bacterium]|nr:mechanosensitive ion channel family protein [Akkermansiaceae bacterium]MDB4541481.1 mechanosensitive ion channel family protein [Akkermansiaceae bacterium]